MKDLFLSQLEQQWQRHFEVVANKELNEIRKHNFDKFVAQGLPTTKQETWKYTNLIALKQQQFSIAERPVVANVITDHFLAEEHYRLVFVDGYFIADASVLPKEQSDFVVMNLQDAIKSHFANLRTSLTAADELNELAQLNTGCFNDGAFIHVTEGAVIDRPIHLLYLNSANKQNQLQTARNIVICGRHSQLNIIEEHVSTDDSVCFSNIVTQFDVQDNAKVDYVKIQKQNLNSYHFANILVKQQQYSEVSVQHINLGAQLAREDLHCYLVGSEASVKINGLYLPLNKQHIDVHTYIYHEADHTTSEEFYKGVVANKSRAVFDGKIIVTKNIKQAVANLQNKNLLLTTDSEVNTKPELEIYSDDVKCRHGATVGQLDKQMLFYLQSRGIPQERAYQLLLAAFLSDSLENLSHQKVVADINNLIKRYCEEEGL